LWTKSCTMLFVPNEATLDCYNFLLHIEHLETVVILNVAKAELVTTKLADSKRFLAVIGPTCEVQSQ